MSRKKAPDPVRQTALTILIQLADRRTTLDRLMERSFADSPTFSRLDKNFLTALVYGVTRWRGRLDFIISRYSNTPLEKISPDVLIALRLGVFQITKMNRVPDSAAVNTSVELVKSVAKPHIVRFANGVLRRVVRKKHDMVFPAIKHQPVKALSVRFSCPLWLTSRWFSRFGLEDTARLLKTVNTVPPLTIRANTLKIDRGLLKKKLEEEGIRTRSCPSAPDALQIEKLPQVIFRLKAFINGGFQVQDEAAQLVSVLVDPRPGEQILDACAGLGGKTGHLAALMKNRGAVTAVDIQKNKLSSLKMEMKRLGVTCVKTVCRDLERLNRQQMMPPSKPFGIQTSAKQVSSGENKKKTGDHDCLGKPIFDRVLVDAPCTGLGVLRRNPDGKWSKTLDDIKRMAARQIRLLRHAAPLVRPGGVLVYAVCSMEPEETDQVVSTFLDENKQFAIETPDSDLSRIASFLTTPGFFRTYPQTHLMDGFFAVRFRETTISKKLNNEKSRITT